MKKKVLGFGCWVLGTYSDCFFMIRCVRQDMGVIRKCSIRVPLAEPPRTALTGTLETKGSRIFALPGVKKHRLFEELARSFCGLAWKGKNPPDVSVPVRAVLGGGMIPFSIFIMTGCPVMWVIIKPF